LSTRQSFALIILCAALVGGLGVMALQAQDGSGMTAAEAFTAGERAFEEGDYSQARTLLRQVDPWMLPKEQRARYQQILPKLDQLAIEADEDAAAADTPEPAEAVEADEPEVAAMQGGDGADAEAPADTDADADAEVDADAVAEVEVDTDIAASEPVASEPVASEPVEVTPPSPQQLLARADAAAGDDPEAAAVLYRMVLNRQDADASTRSEASAGLAQLNRQRNATRTAMLALIDEAAADLRAGDYDAAEAALQQVQASGVTLGRFDQDRVESSLRVIADNRLAEEALAAAGAGALAQAGDDDDMQGGVVDDAGEDGLADIPDPGDGMGVDADGVDDAAADDVPPAPDDIFARANAAAARDLYNAALTERDAGDLREAERMLRQARDLDPDNQAIRATLRAVQNERSRQATPRDFIEFAEPGFGIPRQRAEILYNERIDAAQAALEDGEWIDAINESGQATEALAENKRYFTEEEYATRRDAALEIRNKAIAASEQEAVEEQMRELAERQAEDVRSIEQAEVDAAREVQRLLLEARQLQAQMEYDKALALVNDALVIDPHNIAAQAMQQIIQDVRLLIEYKRLDRLQDVERARLTVQNKEAMVPYTDLLIYPADWPQITERRLKALAGEADENPANIEARRQLSTRIPIEFDENNLANVIDYFRNATGANFDPNWQALSLAQVRRDTPISLNLRDVPADVALDRVLKQAGAETADIEPIGYSTIDGIVTISTLRDLKKATTLEVYDIRDLLAVAPDFGGAPDFDLTSALSNTNSGGGSGGVGGGGGGGVGGGGLFGGAGDGGGGLGDDAPSKDELVEDINGLITESVGTPQEWLDFESTIREYNGNLIVRTTPDNHRAILDLLARLRETRSIQISVEARFLLVDQSFLDEFGIDLDISYVGTGKFGPIDLMQDTISIADRPTTSLTSPRFTDQSGGGTDDAGNPVEEVLSRSLTVGVNFLDDLEVNLLIRATQARERSISLTAPRVTFFNGQRAYVVVARQIAFISDLEPVPDANGFDPTLSVTQSGVVLDVEGVVSADRRYVTLNLRPSLATVVDPLRQIEQVAENDDDDGDGDVVVIDPDTGEEVTQEENLIGFVEAPELELTAVRTSVSIPDRGTLLIGGQRLVAEVEVEAGVPVLSKIPLINRLFTNKSTIQDERTLLILVKPTILIQDEEEDLRYPDLRRNPGAYNIGEAP